MMKKQFSTNKLTVLLTIVFLVASFLFIFYQRVHKPRVFILHSYQENMPWVKSLNKGIEQVFKDKQYVSRRYFYMDTKRRHSRAYLRRVSRTAYNAIVTWKPDIVIVFDDYAQKLVGKKLASHKSMKVIFGGITDNISLHPFAHQANVTGVLEEIPVKAIKEILSLTFPRKKRIYYLSDDSATARALDKNIVNNNWGSYFLVKHKRVKTLHEWKKAVNQAKHKADILLVSVYHTIKDGKRQVDPKKLVKWMNRHSSIPVVGIYESFIVDGGLIAIAVPSLEQGYTAAWLANNIIEGKVNIANIPFVRSKTFSLYIRKRAVKRRFPNAHMPVILSAFAKNHWNLDELTPPELDITSLPQKHSAS